MLPILWVDVKIIFVLFTLGHMVYMKKVFMLIQKGNMWSGHYLQSTNKNLILKTKLFGNIGKENGMEQWSRLYFSDIGRYYSSALGKK